MRSPFDKQYSVGGNHLLLLVKDQGACVHPQRIPNGGHAKAKGDDRQTGENLEPPNKLFTSYSQAQKGAATHSSAALSWIRPQPGEIQTSLLAPRGERGDRPSEPSRHEKEQWKKQLLDGVLQNDGESHEDTAKEFGVEGGEHVHGDHHKSQLLQPNSDQNPKVRGKSHRSHGCPPILLLPI